MQTFKPALTAEDLTQFLAAAFPQMDESWAPKILRVDEQGVHMVKPYEDSQLRPGGTLSGPTMMTLVDTGMYMAVAAVIGPESMAVTSSLQIDFLNRADPVDLNIRCWLTKLGRSLAVGRAELWSAGSDRLCAQASVTYSLVRTNKDAAKDAVSS